MDLSLRELEIIERSLSNQLLFDCNAENEELLRKIRNRINEVEYQTSRMIEWGMQMKCE